MKLNYDNEVETIGLIFIGEIAAAERAKLDPSEFFGHEDDIAALQADPKAAAKMIVQREWPSVDWDGESSLRRVVIERLKAICQRNRGKAHLAVSEMKADAARKILRNYRANGGISKAVVEEAEAVLRKHGEVV